MSVADRTEPAALPTGAPMGKANSGHDNGLTGDAGAEGVQGDAPTLEELEQMCSGNAENGPCDFQRAVPGFVHRKDQPAHMPLAQAGHALDCQGYQSPNPCVSALLSMTPIAASRRSMATQYRQGERRANF